MTSTQKWEITAVTLIVAAVLAFITSWMLWPTVQFNGLTLVAIIAALGGMVIALVKGD
jgi:membrane associated rhomboid family serine protease